MVLELYQLPFSAPCRSVLMVGKILGLDIDAKPLDLMEGEHMKPEFLKINPFHCIPTLVDDGFALWESRAIMTYLVDKYAPGNDLYPKDIQARATVDRWLYWDTGSLYAALAAYYVPVLRKGAKPDPATAQMFVDKAKLLDQSLASSKYLCGDKITLADIAILTTITTGKTIGLDLAGLANIDKWLKQLETDLSNHWQAFVTDPLQKVSEFFGSKLSK